MSKLLIAYLAIGLATFGHAASGNTSCKPGIFTGDDLKLSCIVFRSTVAAYGWPLYWSWAGFEAGRAALQAQEGKDE